jgi:hypothetical protein
LIDLLALLSSETFGAHRTAAASFDAAANIVIGCRSGCA